MPHRAEIQAASIVLRGHFTPAIFHPAWFASRELLRKSEADEAKIQIIHPDAAVFSTGWLEIQVLADRFTATTTQVPYFEALRDLVQGAFDVLDQTPVWALGINQSSHFPLGSEALWHQVGNKLAPKSLWDSILEKPGLLSLTITSLRRDKREGVINVRVEPSARVKYGIFIEVNDHYTLATEETAKPGTDLVLSTIASSWQESMNRADVISKGIVALGES